jgi:hypothetical protein
MRKAVDLRCAVTPKRGRTRRLRVTELSPLGAWIRTTKPLPEGSLLRLRISLPDGEIADVRGEVMWTQTRRSGRGAGMGVELVGLDAAQARRIDAAIDAAPAVRTDDSRFSFADRVA